MIAVINAYASPNWDMRASGSAIQFLIFHYTGMADTAAALARLVDPRAKVSAHYLIDPGGLIYRLVAEERRAWHAGVSRWGNMTDLNSVSIGIEIVNPGHDYGLRRFPEGQMQSVLRLSQHLIAHYQIPPHHCLGHNDIAPERKIDPGPLFPWHWLAERGVGIYPIGSLTIKRF